jgi:histidine phosphotransfer protein HptB
VAYFEILQNSGRKHVMASFEVNVEHDLMDLIPEYLQRRRKDLELLTEAMGCGALNQVEMIGHRLRGNAASYGFVDLTRIGAEMEEAAVAGDRIRVEGLIREYRSYLDGVIVRGI